MIRIAPIVGEDAAFVRLVAGILKHTVEQSRPQDVFVTRIEGWFDHKWLGFAGKILGALGVHDTQRFIIPPFVPGRVLGEAAFEFDAKAGTYRRTAAKELHRKQTSSDNMQRRIAQVSQSGCFLWFSGSTASTDAGSAMMYRCQDGTESGWYAGFRRRGAWQLDKARGISRAELAALMEEACVEEV